MYDSGPEWVWFLIFALAAVGFVAAVVGGIWLLVFIFTHLQWVN